MYNNVKLHHLHSFIAVADRGSLRLAATQLGMTATALSKSVGALEDITGVQLLVRHSRGITLTPLGQAFLARARHIASDLKKAMEEMAQLRGKLEGALTIGVSPTAAIDLLPQVLERFRRGPYGTVHVTVRGGLYDEQVAELRSGSLDLAITPVPTEPLDGSMAHHPLFYNDVVIAGRRGHPMAGGVRSLAELVDCSWILTTGSVRGPGAAILDASREHGLPPPQKLARCDLNGALPAILAGSDALCALPRTLFDQQPATSPLEIIQVRESMPRYLVCLVHRADSPLLPSTAHFATLVLRCAHYYQKEHPERAIASLPLDEGKLQASSLHDDDGPMPPGSNRELHAHRLGAEVLLNPMSPLILAMP